MGRPLCSRPKACLPSLFFIMLEGYDGYGLCRVFGGRERGEKAGKIIFFPASSRAGEEEGASRSKRHHSMFPLLFFEQCMQNIVLHKTLHFIYKEMASKCAKFQIHPPFYICSIKSSIAILILKINSIASLPNSIIGPKFICLFHFSPLV